MSHQNIHYHPNQPYNQPNQTIPANMMGQPPGHPVAMIQPHSQPHGQPHGQPTNWDPGYGQPANQPPTGHQRHEDPYMHQMQPGGQPTHNQSVNHPVNHSEMDHSQQDIFPTMGNMENQMHPGHSFDIANNPEINDLSNIFHIYDQTQAKSDTEKSDPDVKTEL